MGLLGSAEPWAVVQSSSCSLLQDIWLTGGPSGPVEEGLVKIVRSKGTADRANVHCWWDKIFWKLCQKKQTLQLLRKYPLHFGGGKSDFADMCNWILLCLDKMLFSDGEKIFETNFKHLIQMICLLKCQGWFKKVLYWIIQNTSRLKTVVFLDCFSVWWC